MYSLCLYLKLHQDELLPHDTHYIDRSEAFFTKSHFDNVLMWENCIEACLNNKNPSTTPITKDEISIKRHFRVVRAKRKRGRPKKKQTKKSTPSSKNKNKKPWTQSSMTLYFNKEQNEENENEDSLITEPAPLPTNTQLPDESNKGLRRSSRSKRKIVSDLDNYKIVHRSNMITYKQRLKRYKQKNKSEAPAMTPPQRFKRRQSTPSPTELSSNINWMTQHRVTCALCTFVA